MYRRVTLSAADAWIEVTIQGGPLRGRRFACNLRQERDYFIGNYEPEVVNELARLVKPGDVVIEAGGHTGYLSLVLATLVGTAGRVVVFEPSEDNLELLRRNLSLNEDLYDAVAVIPLAVADRAERMGFDAGSSRWTGQLAAGAAADTTVETTTIDEFVRNSGLKPALVKMDIEGAESLALPGMTRILSTERPIVLVEIHNAEAFRVFTLIMAEADYGIHPLEEGIVVTPQSWRRRTQYLATPINRSE